MIAIAMMIAATAAEADDHRDLSSDAPKKSMSQRIRDYAQNCFDQEMALFERVKGRLPTDDEADLIIDACANPRFKN